MCPSESHYTHAERKHVHTQASFFYKSVVFPTSSPNPEVIHTALIPYPVSKTFLSLSRVEFTAYMAPRCESLTLNAWGSAAISQYAEQQKP